MIIGTTEKAMLSMFKDLWYKFLCLNYYAMPYVIAISCFVLTVLLFLSIGMSVYK